MKRTGSRCSRFPSTKYSLTQQVSLAAGVQQGLIWVKFSGFCHATGTDAIAKQQSRLYAYHDSGYLSIAVATVVQPAAATSPYSSPVLTKLDRWKLTRYSSAGCQPCRGLTLLGVLAVSDREHFCPFTRYMCSGRWCVGCQNISSV